MVATDRRTSGTQVEDETIEMKAGSRIREAVGDRGHVNVTSYNRTVLLTGEVPTEADKAKVEAAVRPIENVKNVMNELAVHPTVSLGEMSNDAVITSKVKASFVDAPDIFANSYKVVTEHGVVYLMGRVTEREANRAVELARGVTGVRKVVKAFELISEDELRTARRPRPRPARRRAERRVRPPGGRLGPLGRRRARRVRRAGRVRRSRSRGRASPPALASRGPPRRSASSAQPLDQARGVPAAAAQRLHVGVELVDQRRHRQPAPLRCASSRHSAEVLAHPVDREAEVELSSIIVGRGCPSASSAPRPCRSRSSTASCRARPSGRRRCLATALHQPGDRDLVDHLGQLPGAAVADARHRLGEVHRQRLHRVERRGVAAAHDRQRAVDCPGLAARDRRVDELQGRVPGPPRRAREPPRPTPSCGRRRRPRSACRRRRRPPPSTTDRRSASLPTQANTNSAPAAASRGVAAWRPPCSAAQACALAAVRL
jgi:osmotically-inducible protein OsmY